MPVFGEVPVSISLLEVGRGPAPPITEPETVETIVLPPEMMALPCSLVTVVPPLTIITVDPEAGWPAGGDWDGAVCGGDTP